MSKPKVFDQEQQLKKAREGAGLSLKEAGDLSGKHPEYLRAVEDKRKPVTASILAIYSALSGTPLHLLARRVRYDLLKRNGRPAKGAA